MGLSEQQLYRRVGGVGLVTLALGVALFVRLEGKHLTPGMRVHVVLERTGALVAGADVVLAGRTIGTVDDIRLVPRGVSAPSYAEDPTAERAGVVLDVWLERRWARRLPENSEFFQNQPSILSGAYLEIGPPRGGVAPGPPLREGSTVRGVDPPRMDQIAQRSYENLRQVVEMLRTGFPEARALGRELDELSAQLDALSTPADIDALVDGRRRLWAEGLAAWEAWLATGVDADDFARVATRAQATFARTRASLAQLRGRIDQLTANLELVRTSLDPARFGRFEEALRRVDELTVRADALLVNAEQLAAMVARGEGTIGAFLSDTELADEFKALTKILKERPWETVGHPDLGGRPK